jgi:hypothetical protein
MVRVQSARGAVQRWWRRIRRRRRLQGYTFVAAMDEELALTHRGVAVVGSMEAKKWATFACPCRCGEMIALNLMRSHSPRWTIELHADGSISLAPSVVATRCGSHFWIRRSRVEWVEGV